MAMDKSGARLMEWFESPGAGAGSARVGGCNGIRLREVGTETGLLEGLWIARSWSGWRLADRPVGGLGAGRGYAVTCESNVKTWSLEMYRWSGCDGTGRASRGRKPELNWNGARGGMFCVFQCLSLSLTRLRPRDRTRVCSKE